MQWLAAEVRRLRREVNRMTELMPQVPIRDGAVDLPVQKQVQVPMGMKVKKAVPDQRVVEREGQFSPVLIYEETVNEPVQRQMQVPMDPKVQRAAETPQVLELNLLVPAKVQQVAVPPQVECVVQSLQVPQTPGLDITEREVQIPQVIEREVQIPQVRILGETVDEPVQNQVPAQVLMGGEVQKATDLELLSDDEDYDNDLNHQEYLLEHDRAAARGEVSEEDEDYAVQDYAYLFEHDRAVTRGEISEEDEDYTELDYDEIDEIERCQMAMDNDLNDSDYQEYLLDEYLNRCRAALE